MFSTCFWKTTETQTGGLERKVTTPNREPNDPEKGLPTCLSSYGPLCFEPSERSEVAWDNVRSH